jgi:thiol reductant ABC exporter CydC subunit
MTRTLPRLVRLAGVEKRRVVASVVLGAFTVLFGVGLMATAGYLISRAAEHPPILALTTAIVAVRFFGLARPAARYFERLASHDLALRSLTRVRRQFYEGVEPLAPAQLEGYRNGELLDRMVGDVDALQNLYLRGLGPPLVAALTGAVCVGVTAAMLPAAAAILAAGLIAGGIVVPIVAARLGRGAGRRRAATRAALTAELVELLRGAPELVAFGREEAAIERIRRADRDLVRLGRRDAFAAGIADSLAIVVAGATVVGVLAVAVHAHDGGTLDRVLVAALALLALAAFESVAPLAQAARELAATVTAGRNVLELIDREPAVRDVPAPARRGDGAPSVVLERITAAYADAQRPVLTAFDLRLEPRRKVALVGPSGAGKTTVVNLLLRFLDPVRGRVTIDGRDIREYAQEDVRGVFALAGQNAHLFDTTIRANLLLARPSASELELTSALGQARLADWVASLPEGLDTIVGEDGMGLSGGQRQRLVLARALLADAPVLVLDEPTAHLDTATAERLMDEVLDASADRTVLLITHRPEGLAQMDEIVALPDDRAA